MVYMYRIERCFCCVFIFNAINVTTQSDIYVFMYRSLSLVFDLFGASNVINTLHAHIHTHAHRPKWTVPILEMNTYTMLCNKWISLIFFLSSFFESTHNVLHFTHQYWCINGINRWKQFRFLHPKHTHCVVSKFVFTMKTKETKKKIKQNQSKSAEHSVKMRSVGSAKEDGVLFVCA